MHRAGTGVARTILLSHYGTTDASVRRISSNDDVANFFTTGTSLAANAPCTPSPITIYWAWVDVAIQGARHFRRALLATMVSCCDDTSAHDLETGPASLAAYGGFPVRYDAINRAVGDNVYTFRDFT